MDFDLPITTTRFYTMFLITIVQSTFIFPLIAPKIILPTIFVIQVDFSRYMMDTKNSSILHVVTSLHSKIANPFFRLTGLVNLPLMN